AFLDGVAVIFGHASVTDRRVGRRCRQVAVAERFAAPHAGVRKRPPKPNPEPGQSPNRPLSDAPDMPYGATLQAIVRPRVTRTAKRNEAHDDLLHNEPERYLRNGDWWRQPRKNRYANLQQALENSSSPDDRAVRRRIADELVQMADRAWDRYLQYRAYDPRWRATVALARGATGAAAAVSGGALLASVRGSLAAALG